MRKKEIAKKIMAVLMVLAMLVTSFMIYQPQTVEAAAKNRITLNASKMMLYAGESYNLKAIAIYQNGELKYPGIVEKGLSYKNLKFTSSNKSVAEVSKKGVIKAKKKGTVKITVSSIYDSTVKGTLKLTVKGKPKKSKITLYNKSVKLGVGETTVISVKKVKGISSKDVTFKSGNKAVAAVDQDGWIKAKKEGTAKITVTSVRNKKAKATFKVTVTAKASQTTPKGEIKLKKDYGAVYNIPISPDVPDKRYATTKIEIQSITGVKSKEVTYKSSDKSVVTVDENGVVSFANKERNYGDVVTVTVVSKENPQIKAEFKVYAMRVGLWKNLAYQPSRGHAAGSMFNSEVVPDDLRVVVTSSDENVVEVHHSDVTGQNTLSPKEKGTAIVTYQIPSCSFYWSNTVTVSDDPSSAYNCGGRPFYPDGN